MQLTIIITYICFVFKKNILFIKQYFNSLSKRKRKDTKPISIMKKYNFENYMKLLSKEDYDLAMVEIRKLLKEDMTPKHFKYNILRADMNKAPNLRINQLIAVKNYLQERLPGRKKIKLDDLVNEPSSQAEAA